MKTEKILYTLMGFTLGVFLTVIVADVSVNGHHSNMMGAMGMHTDSSQHMMMNGSTMDNNNEMK